MPKKIIAQYPDDLFDDCPINVECKGNPLFCLDYECEHKNECIIEWFYENKSDLLEFVVAVRRLSDEVFKK